MAEPATIELPAAAKFLGMSRRAMARKKLIQSIYFIQHGKDGPIKIGMTKGDVRQRLGTMQSGNPIDLHLIGIMVVPRMVKAFEARLHARFRGHHIRGEWFHPADEILAFIRDGAKPCDLVIDMSHLGKGWESTLASHWGVPAEEHGRDGGDVPQVAGGSAMRTTPGQLARDKGRSRNFVMKLIHAGELPARDESAPGSKRPTFTVDPADWERWEASRQFVPATPSERKTVEVTTGILARMQAAKRNRPKRGRARR